MNVELTINNCPFCGGNARPHEVSSSLFVVRCIDCSARGPIHEDRLQAVQLWNKRGGLGNSRVALVDASIPIETFKLVERVREAADRIEAGDLGSPTVGTMLLLDEERRQMTIHALRISKAAAEPMVVAALDAYKAARKAQIV